MRSRAMAMNAINLLLPIACAIGAWQLVQIQPKLSVVHASVAAFACFIGMIINTALWSDLPPDRPDADPAEGPDDY